MTSGVAAGHDSQSEDPARVFCVRTPPPLARNPLLVSQRAIDDSSGFLAPGPVPEDAFRMELVEWDPDAAFATPTTDEIITSQLKPNDILASSRIQVQASAALAGPTTTEFIMTQVWEALALQSGRKTKSGSGEERIKGAKKVSTYDDKDVVLMHVMRGSMQISFHNVVPWLVSERVWFEDAKAFAKKHTTLPVDELVNEEFLKSVS
ncbi:hypothetical protein FRC06_010322 [Ceratobasidium sp. 370]|nr:hypothetical protein FRC06_010322 [Ceratobasidium sp. 370]